MPVLLDAAHPAPDGSSTGGQRPDPCNGFGLSSS